MEKEAVMCSKKFDLDPHSNGGPIIKVYLFIYFSKECHDDTDIIERMFWHLGSMISAELRVL